MHTGDEGRDRRVVLVVEDDPAICEVVVDAVEAIGHRSLQETSGLRAIRRVREADPDLLVLDVGLPDVDGYAVCSRIRADGYDGAVLFLTARGSDLDLWEGYTRGADDYLRKPFSVSELMLRIDALLRRTAVPPRPVITVGDLVIDPAAVDVRRGGERLQLSPREYALLRHMAEHAGVVLSRRQLIDAVWDGDPTIAANTVETYVRYLRAKVDADRPPMIHTVRGFGYVLRLAG
ncbi:MAG TPA: response regulator transcription factor [Euzebya sp.]|nr:response regulator transcription factor [Euzebya sp.]